METPREFIERTAGKVYDIDKAYGAQCWDYFAYFVQSNGLNVSTFCKLTGYAGDLWKLRDVYKYSNYFTYVYNIGELKNGDWVFWPQHVALYYNGKQYGQRQGGTGVTAKPLNRSGFLGALRFRGWSQEQSKGVARMYEKARQGRYKAQCHLNLRTGPGTSFPVLKVLKQGTEFNFWGYYDVDEVGRMWYYISVGGSLGFVCAEYLARV